MSYSTTEVYSTKRETIRFSKSLVASDKQVESKFVTQAIYGMLKLKSLG